MTKLDHKNHDCFLNPSMTLVLSPNYCSGRKEFKFVLILSVFTTVQYTEADIRGLMKGTLSIWKVEIVLHCTREAYIFFMLFI
jgi:hypothetical protein